MSVNGLPSDTYGTLWRFLVANDNEVSRYIIRDADSVVNIRESVAVDEWLQSNRHFHLMRDHYDHSELGIGRHVGWCARRASGAGPAIRAWLCERATVASGKTTDQVFLREFLWPTIRQGASSRTIVSLDLGETREFPFRRPSLPPGT